MATGEVTTLPSVPEDDGSGSFPASFKEPKRLYCKNGGFFLRIRSDGGVDGIREKTDPHSESRLLLLLQGLFMYFVNKQEESVSEVSEKEGK